MVEATKAKKSADLEVVSVAPSLRAFCRIRRIKARAQGRPRLAVRRAIATAIDVTKPTKIDIRRRKRLHSQVVERENLLTDFRKTRSELVQLTLDKNRLEAELARERHQSQELHDRVASQQKQLAQAVARAESTESESQRVQWEVALAKERRQNQDLQAQLTSKVHQLERLSQEKARLEKLVKDLRRPKVTEATVAGPSKLGQQALAKQIADSECRILEHSSWEIQQALQKRLLLKWHPDKQPSAENAHLATLVVQEMQNLAVWRNR
jgi:chromosome segregation ATPase